MNSKCLQGNILTIAKRNLNNKKKSNNRFNLTNPLAWFLREDNARTTPSPTGTDLKVKRMLDLSRSIRRGIYAPE